MKSTIETTNEDLISSCFKPFPHLINTDGDFKE